MAGVMKKACLKCCYFEPTVLDFDDKTVALGECRRHSPGPIHSCESREQASADHLAQWPQVDPADWCGEFA